MRQEAFERMWLDKSPTSWLVDIDDYFRQSTVSYYGLNTIVPHCTRATAVIKGRSVDLSSLSKDQIEKLASSCRLLYGLLHQRYVTSEDGIRQLHAKVQRGVYGKCPRTACKGQHVIPMGLSIELGVDTVKLWCPKCHDIYNCDSKLDGAFFGPDLPVMFHKLNDIPLRFRASTDLLKEYKREDGTVVPAVKQRLYRWGEKKPE